MLNIITENKLKGFLCRFRLLVILIMLTSILFRIDVSASESKHGPKPYIMTSFADIVEPLMPSVVNIYTVKYPSRDQGGNRNVPDIIPYGQFNDFFEQFNVPFTFEELYSNPRALSLGSGVIIDKAGLIVTNHHVVAGSDEVNIKFFDNTELSAKVIGSDPKTDLALLKVEGKKSLSPAKFGDSSKARIGDVVIAIGNPLGFGGTVTTGIISSKSRDLGMSLDELVDDFIQTDAAINSGNSGGPLFNINGEVIGVNTAIPAAGGGTNIGIGFAIPSNTVTDIISKLEENGKVSRGRLDIAIQEVTKDLANAMSLENDYGALIVEVKPGGVGSKAGLKRGDVIVEFNEQKVLNTRKLQLFVADSDIGKKVKLGVMRQSKKISLTAEMIESSSDSNMYKRVKKQPKPIEVGSLKISNISSAIVGTFDINADASGVVVVDVAENIADINLRAGDVIMSIDQQRIDNVDIFVGMYEALKQKKKNSAVLLVKRGEYTLFVALPIN